MIEGRVHVPLHKIQENIDSSSPLPAAPFYRSCRS